MNLVENLMDSLLIMPEFWTVQSPNLHTDWCSVMDCFSHGPQIHTHACPVFSFKSNVVCKHLLIITCIITQNSTLSPTIVNFVPVCQQNVSFEGMYNVLSTQPVLNKVSKITGLKQET